jgi:chromosome segregation ATPase
MSRRWIPRRTEPDTAGQPATESVEQALITSITTNRQLRAELDAVETKLTATQAQLEFHKGALVDAKVKLGLTTDAVERLELRLSVLVADLDRERKHTVGSCSHAADLKTMGAHVGALEKRVAELQHVNEGYEAPGWLPRTEPAATTRRGWR